MKKTYIIPTTRCIRIVSKPVMISTSGTKITSTNIGDFDYARSDKGWDIWGSGDDEE